MSTIEISNITKDYGGKGVFNVSLNVEKGEVMGFLGPNGAGKTTTIRQLMGFIRPQSGSVKINGLTCFENAAQIQKSLGYLPGEIAFLDDITGDEFIKFIAGMKGLKSLDRANELKSYFELDAGGKIKKMSKGMKQKIGIVCAFMQTPEILILDEPSSGLDPLMQSKFIELILNEKKRGATILMSSHIFEEIERTCDRTAIIRDGRIVAVESIAALREGRKRTYTLTLAFEADARALAAAMGLKEQCVDGCVLTARVKSADTLIKAAAKYTVTGFEAKAESLEELFMHFYGGETV